MKRRLPLWLTAAALAVALVMFELGRRSTLAWTSAGRARNAPASATDSGPSPARETEKIDLSKVTIENLGDVEFDHAYNLLQAASPEVLSDWTRRLEALPTGPRKTAGIAAFFKTLAQLDTKTAADLALTLTRREARATAIAAISAAAPASHLSEVARLLSSLGTERMSATDLIVNWSRTDPVSTGQFVLDHPEMAGNNDVSLLLNNWATLDPAAAKAWLDNLEAGRRDADVYAGFYSGWFESDKGTALNHLIAHAGNEQLKKAVEDAALVLFLDSPDATRMFVMQLPEGLPRTAAISEITVQATGRVLGGGELPLKADSVAKWLVTLPENHWQDNLGIVVTKWSDEDPAAVDRWINDMPAQTRDRVAAEFCLAYDWEEPQRNFVAGLNITDRRLRDETFRKLFEKVGSKKRAKELLQRANLPPEQMAELERIRVPSI